MASTYLSPAFFLLFLFMTYAGAGFSCSLNNKNQHTLGEYKTYTQKNKPLILFIKAYDTNLKIVRKLNHREFSSFSPSGRNGYEFIYIPPQQHTTELTLCLFSKYQYSKTANYRITQLKDVSSKVLHAMELMDKAAQTWPENSQNAKSLAVAYYNQVSKLNITQFNLSSYARLYRLNINILNYQYQKALHLAEVILSHVPESSYLGYSAYWAKGKVLLRQNNHKKAITAFRHALNLAESIKIKEQASSKDIADIKNWLAEAYLMDGQINAGRELLNEALTLAENDYQLLGAIHNNLGFISILKSNRESGDIRSRYIKQSIAEHNIARDYSLKAGDLLELAYIENNLASLYQRIGDLRKAREHYWQALNLIDYRGTPFRFQVIYTNLGTVYQHLGDYQKSESFLTKALDIAGKTLSSPYRLSQLQCRLGNTQRLMGKLKAALANHKLCIQSATTENNRELLIQARYELAEDHILLGNIRKARDNSTLIINKLIVDNDQDSGLYSQVLNQFAKLNRLEGKLEQAIETINSALVYSQSSRNPTLHIQLLHEAMLIYKALKDLPKALKFGLKALSEVEQLHQYLEVERLGPAWSKISHEIYLDVTDIVLSEYLVTGEEKKLYQALNLLERSRAITLRQEFTHTDKLEQKPTETKHLLTLSELADSHANNSTNKDYTPLPLSYYHEHELLNHARLTGRKNTQLPAVLDHRQIQEKLARGQTVLYYLVLKEDLFVLTITRDKISLHYQGESGQLNQLLQTARRMISDINSSPYQTLISLSRLLLPPATILKNTDDLILVLHRNLHALPFAALPLTGTLPAYIPLSKTFNLQVTPSLTSYFMSKQNGLKNNHDLDLAMLANPQLTTLTDKITEQRNPEDKTDLKTWSHSLPPLPWTAHEANNLKKIFAQKHYRIYTGKAANRKNLWSKKVRHARILHIASHGYFHSLNPDNIGFSLSSDEQSGSVSSGFITLTELFSFHFNNELVVISGCDTGMGKKIDGEGMMGLSRGFISQGAKHVISTLWPISDKASAKFMQLFYQRLKQLGEVDRALSAAQNDMRSIPTYRHPFYWAAYVLNTVSPDQSLIFEQPDSY